MIFLVTFKVISLKIPYSILVESPLLAQQKENLSIGYFMQTSKERPS